MFKFSKQLFDGGDYKLRATNYEWPFAFQFPENFNGDLAGLDNPSRGFTVGPQPLPPSTSVENAMGSSWGKINYKLEAVIPKNFINIKAERFLNFSPVRLETAPHSMHVNKKQIESQHEQKFRFDAVGPRSLTTKESFKDHFHSNPDTKIIKFRVEISAPTVVVIGKTYPIMVTLKSTTTEEIVPEIKLDSIEAHFKAFTQIRTSGTFGDYVRDYETAVPLITSKGGLNIKLLTNEAVPVTGVFANRIYAPPNFSTVSMCTTYRLSVHLKLRCLDDIYKSSCKWPTVMLLPAKMEEGIEEAAELIASGNFGIQDDAALATGEEVPTYAPDITEDVPPPTYNEVQKGG
jgi:hypothetical protein